MEQQKNILVIDDDQDLLNLIASFLGRQGLNFTTACNAKQALEVLQEQNFDLVISDIVMPVMDGIQLLKEIRNDYSFCDLPVIVLSALDSKYDILDALQAGANDYMVKPFDVRVFRERIKLHLKGQFLEKRTFAGFYLQELLSRGRMSLVYRAIEMEHGKEVAIKILPKALCRSQDCVKRFLQEAQLAQRVKHPNLVKVFGHGKHENEYYLIMELVQGKTLDELASDGPMLTVQVIDIILQITGAIKAIAEQGILHRDVKPKNIMQDFKGIYKLIDFGIARGDLVDSQKSKKAEDFGTPIYVAPEQHLGKDHVTSDVYSLGCTMFKLLTGTPPFSRDLDIHQLYELKIGVKPRVSDTVVSIPKALDDLMVTMMEPDPSKRCGDWNHILKTLQKVRNNIS